LGVSWDGHDTGVVKGYFYDDYRTQNYSALVQFGLNFNAQTATFFGEVGLGDLNSPANLSALVAWDNPDYQDFEQSLSLEFRAPNGFFYYLEYEYTYSSSGSQFTVVTLTSNSYYESQGHTTDLWSEDLTVIVQQTGQWGSRTTVTIEPTLTSGDLFDYDGKLVAVLDTQRDTFKMTYSSSGSPDSLEQEGDINAQWGTTGNYSYETDNFSVSTGFSVNHKQVLDLAVTYGVEYDRDEIYDNDYAYNHNIVHESV
jgi:hypothetical protein